VFNKRASKCREVYFSLWILVVGRNPLLSVHELLLPSLVLMVQPDGMEVEVSSRNCSKICDWIK
jgi:hypothetical protein